MDGLFLLHPMHFLLPLLQRKKGIKLFKMYISHSIASQNQADLVQLSFSTLLFDLGL